MKSVIERARALALAKVFVIRVRDQEDTDMNVFKMARELALKTYAVTKKFPREETFSLVDQIRRTASGHLCCGDGGKAI